MEPISITSFRHSDEQAGVYLFSENGRHLYIGRSNHIRKRWGRHCNPASTVQCR